MATSTKEEFQGRSFIKTLSIILISFISLPLITMGIMYFTNEGFKDNANKILSVLPGAVGNYFQGMPTKDEREELKTNIGKYYIKLDEDRIVDKLLIVKGEDEELYNDLIVIMSRENPNKMKTVKENLRTMKFKNDPINRILSEIDKESEEKLNILQKYYGSLPITQAINEIERTHGSNEITAEELAKLFEKLKPDQAAKYLFYLDLDLVNKIKYKLPNETLRNIEKKLQELESKQQKLIELALVYENKSIDEAVTDLGNTSKYNMEELAFIFKNLSITKGSKILSKLDNNDFMLTLLSEINQLEELQNERLSTSATLTKGMEIYKEYDKKINELTSIYQKTTADELTKIFEAMLKKNETYQKHTLDDLEEIVFTEEQLVIDILKKLKTNTVAEILEKMEEKNKIILSKKLLK